MGCFSRPQMPLLPTMATTGAAWRTSVSKSIRENPAAPSPSMRKICLSGRPCVWAAVGAGAEERPGGLGVDELPGVGAEIAAVAPHGGIGLEPVPQLAV